MEAGGAALWRSLATSGAGIRPGCAGDSSSSSSDGRRSFRIPARPSGVSCGGGGGFSDEGHLKYYVSLARCGGSKKEEKKRANLVKGLARDLSMLYCMSFGLESGEGLAGEVQGKMISGTAELLQAQLKQLRAQEKEMKRKRKKEKATMKAAKMKVCADDGNSSSSSESSDSECESVVKMSNPRTAIVAEPKSEDLTIPPVAPNYNSAPLPLELSKTGDGIEENNSRLNLGPECLSNSTTTTASKRASKGFSSNSTAVEEKTMDKIEVCMGGKCKKSGALQLLEEFKRKISIEGAVVGCKCLGKCNNGPNVRIVKHNTDEDYVKDVKHLLCIGIGLDDVGTIVTSLFGKEDATLTRALVDFDAHKF